MHALAALKPLKSRDEGPFSMANRGVANFVNFANLGQAATGAAATTSAVSISAEACCRCIRQDQITKWRL